ncbi:MAG: hypothetical protein HYX75_08580 [Acidobacteria bacterium]|nr:hypothetical protein [Acidobacteriota bacterium]
MLIVGGITLLVILWVPGYLTWRALRPEQPGGEGSLSAGECAFATLAIGFYLVSWFAITLVEFGRFRPAVAFGGLSLYCFVARLVAYRRAISGASASGWRSLLPLVVILALVPAYRPFEYVLGGRDPGLYVNAGIIIAREGGVPFRDPLIDQIPPEDLDLFLGDYSSHGIITTERLQGFWYPMKPLEAIVPQAMHLLPSWLALGRWLLGYPGLLWITPFLALFSTASFYYCCSRFAGAPAAIISTLLFIASPVQIYFARYPTSEILVQALIWSSLYFFQLFTTTARRSWAFLAGAGAGLALLARLDSLLLLVPVCLVAAYYFVILPRERNVVFFVLPFGLLLIQTVLHLTFISRPYVLSVIKVLGADKVLTDLALPGFVVLVMVVYLVRERLRSAAARLSNSKLLSAALALLVAAAASYVWFYRPSHPRGHWDLGNANSFKYFAFLMGAFGTAYFVAALIYFVHGQKRRNVFLSFLALVWIGFYFYRLQIYPELIWAARRFVPVIWPVAFAVIGLLLGRLWAGRWPLRAAALVIAVPMAIHTVKVAPMYFSLREYDGAIDWVRRVGDMVGPEDLIVFEPRFAGTLQTLSLPLWSISQENVLQFVFGNPPGAKLEHLVEHWKRSRGGRVLVALQGGVEIASPHLQGRLIYSETASFPMLEQVYNGFPKRVVPFVVPLKIYELELRPGGWGGEMVDLGGGDDDLLVSSFFAAERSGETTFRWSTYKGGIFLPGFDATVRQVEIRLTQGPRPEVLGRASCVVMMNGVRIGVIWPTPDFAVYRFDVPKALRMRAQRGEPVSIFLRVTPFAPRDYIPGSDDVRILGVAVDSVKMIRDVGAGGTQPAEPGR